MQGRPVVGAGATIQRASRFIAPKSIPTFKPVPFKQDKFLSLKSRNAETYFNARNQMLKRSVTITDQIRKQRADDITDGEISNDVDKPSFPVEMTSPLTTHMADEIVAWNRKVKNIEAQQGFVMADEMVYEAISRNIQWGAVPYALDWLRKAVRERRVPLPARVLHDLSSFMDSVLSSIPSSSSSLLVSPDMITGDVSLSSLHVGNDEQRAVRGQFVNSTPYVQHILGERFVPVWQCLSILGFLPGAVHAVGPTLEGVNSVEHTKNNENLTEFLFSSENTKEESDAKTLKFALDVIDRVCVGSSGGGETALRSITRLLLSLAQCAAEAKEAYVLLELQLVFCVLFVEQRSGHESSEERQLRRHPWCTGSKEDEEIFYRFANDFVSSTCYGRQAYRCEMELNACLEANRLVGSTKSAADQDLDVNEEDVVKGEGEEDYDDEEKEGREQVKEEEEDGEDTEPADNETDVASLQRYVDKVLAQLLRGEPEVLAAASPYVAMALRDSQYLPAKAHPFSSAEITWMRLHCDMCAGVRDDGLTGTLSRMLSPGGDLSQALDATADLMERQCLFALASGTVVAVAAAAPTPEDRQAVAEKATMELMDLSNGAILSVYTSAVTALLLPRDATGQLQAIAAKVVEQPISFGNAYGVLLLVLVRAGLWADVGRLLRMLIAKDDANGISSVLVDQRMWANIFREARDAGEAELCVLMRQNREKLFY